MDARPDPQSAEVDQPIDFEDTDDCLVIRLPTISAMLSSNWSAMLWHNKSASLSQNKSALSYDTSAAEAAASPAHWQALAAAVMSEATFDEIDAALAESGPSDAEVIELDLWRG